MIIWDLRILCLLVLLVFPTAGMGQNVDWKTTASEAVDTLQHYFRFNTTVPPGDVTEAAEFLQDILEREEIAFTRYEASPGKINLSARLKGSGDAKPILLLHHMDVVPADANPDGVNPFGGELKDGHIWGRGAMDMKGTGVLQLYAFLTLTRQKIPLDRDIIFMAVNDEEIGGTMGTRYLLDHYYEELDPEYVLDEGGVGSHEIFVNGKLVFGFSVAEKRALWLRVMAHGIAGHGSQPNDQNPNDKLMEALNRLFSTPFPTVPNPVLDALVTRLAKVYECGLGKPVGSVLPLQRWKAKDGQRQWATARWPPRSHHLFLVPGDSPIGFRLPLPMPSLPIIDPKDYPYINNQNTKILFYRFPVHSRVCIKPHNTLLSYKGTP